MRSEYKLKSEITSYIQVILITFAEAILGWGGAHCIM
jgi:hypothetical protein